MKIRHTSLFLKNILISIDNQSCSNSAKVSRDFNYGVSNQTLKELHKHGLVGLTAKYLIDDKGCDADWVNQVRKADPSNRLHCTKLVAVQQNITKVLVDAGLKVCLIKGLADNLALHDDVFVTAANDIDILLPQGQIQQALRVLSAVGWIIKYPVPTDQFDKRWSLIRKIEHSVVLYHDVYQVELDLHWKLAELPIWPVEEESLWSDYIEAFNWCGIDCYRMNPFGRYLYSLSHGYKSHWYKYKWIVNAATARKYLKDQDFDRFPAVLRQLDSHFVALCNAIRQLDNSLLDISKTDNAEQNFRCVQCCKETCLSRHFAFHYKTLINLNGFLNHQQLSTFQHSLYLLSFCTDFRYFWHWVRLYSINWQDIQSLDLPKSANRLYYLLRIPLLIKRKIFKR